MPLGSIVIDLLMRTGAFETDTKRAEKALAKFQKQTAETAKTVALFAVAAVGAAAFAFDNIVKGAAQFKDLEETSGASAESLAALAISAATADTPMQAVADAANKLTKNLVGVDDESKAAGAALAALGIPLAEFKRLDPAGRFEAAAKALGQFKDGTEKVAVAQALFGKSGAEMLRFLKQLEEDGGRQATLTQSQIELADRYADAQARSAAQLKAYLQIVATDALPAITALQGAFVELVKEIVNTSSVTSDLTKDKAVQKWAEEAALFVAGFVDSLREVAAEIRLFIATTNKEFESLNVLRVRAVSGPEFLRNLLGVDNSELKAALDARNQAIAGADAALAAKKALDGKRFTDLVKQQFAQQAQRGIEDRKFDPRQRLAFEGPKDDASSKRLVDQSLKDIENALQRERDLLSARNRFLDIFNAQGLISIKDYYAAQNSIIEEATAKQSALIQQQIDTLRAARPVKAEDKIANDTKINDLLAKRAKLQQDAGLQGIELAVKQAEDERKLADTIGGLNVQVLELQGNLVAAAAIRFDAQNFDLVRKLTTEGKTGALELVQTLREATLRQTEFTQAASESAHVFEQLRNQEERIAIARQAGATTELESLGKLGEARRATIAQLEALAQAQEAIARAAGGPAGDAMRAAAERTRIELEKLRVTADPLGDKFRDIFTSGATSAIEGFLDKTLTAREAFNQFVSSVLAGISRIAAQGVSESLFGKGSSGGNIIGDVFGAIFGGAKAGGGDVFADREYIVGERGPETFRPRVNGTIIPNEATRRGAERGGDTYISVPVQGSVDRRTRFQIANDIAREQRAAGRLE